MISVNKIVSILLLFLFSTNFSTSIYYIVLFLFINSFFFLIDKCKIPFSKKEDYIAASFLLIWIYGIIVGIMRNNIPSYIVANFAGMSCYLTYFILTMTKCKIEKISKILLISGVVVSVGAIIRLFSYIGGVEIPIISSIIGTDVGISSTGQLRVYFSTLVVAYPLLGISLYTFLLPSLSYSVLCLNRKSISFFFLLLSISALFFVASSKGFLLGAVFVVLMIPLCVYANDLIHFKLNKTLATLVLLVILIVGALIYFDYFSIMEMMFSQEDSSNNERYNQLTYIINDCSLFGKGLGAIVPGVVRSEEGPYGFELTYINLMHKFGILSLVLFANWIYMFVELMRFILTKKSIYNSIIALSSLGYLFPSIGNPLLMHPSLVILNCLTLYYIRIIRNE